MKRSIYPSPKSPTQNTTQEELRGTVLINPFSTNKAWKGQRFKTTEYKEWRKEFSLKVIPSPSPEKWFTIQMVFFIKEFGRADQDNFCKTTLDALVDSGIIKDDRYCIKMVSEKRRVKTKEEEKIEIVITPLKGDF